MAEAKPMTAITARVFALILALALGDFLYLRAMEGWTNYWLLNDVQEGIALVTGESWAGHGVVLYQYSVGQREYSGKSHRNLQDPKYKSVPIGGKSIVYFSASHPWISSLNTPRTLISGLPVVVIVLIFEAFAIITVIRPTSSWAFNFMNAQRPSKSTSPPMERRTFKTSRRRLNFLSVKLLAFWVSLGAIWIATAGKIPIWITFLLPFAGLVAIAIWQTRVSSRHFLWTILTTHCPQCGKWPMQTSPDSRGTLICEKCQIEWEFDSNAGSFSYNNNDFFKGIYENIDKQIQSNDPPQLRETFERLKKEGCSADEARRLISAVVAVEAFYIVQTRKPFNSERYAWNLKRLPQMPWDAQGKEIYQA